jgi:hypothetical protein
LGFSCLQGPHQLAQKSTNTYLPLKEESDTELSNFYKSEISVEE